MSSIFISVERKHTLFYDPIHGIEQKICILKPHNTKGTKYKYRKALYYFMNLRKQK